MADKDAAVSQFVAVTGSDAGTASFYLSAADYDVDAAVGAFFESGGAPAPETTGGAPEPVPAAAADVAATAAPSSAAATSARPAAAAPARRTGGFATLDSIGAGRDSDDDESGKNYYAGGEKSGQMIQDPRDRARNRGGPSGGPSGVPGDGEGAGSLDDADGEGDLSDAIFERARQRGPLTDAERDEFQGPQNFAGAGYRLGDANAPARPDASAPDVVGRRNVTRTLTFYANGFTIDDGPLRAFDDPANAAFLQDIKRGFVPKEMEEPGVGNVSINLVDNKGTEYVPPRPALVPFAGGGNRLGSESPAATAAASSAAPDTAAGAAVVVVDNSAPVASIQVRLSDGSRVVARLNETHTVQNLRDFVAASRPGVTSFTLATTFPRKTLDDPTLTIKDAGLSGAVVVQSLA
jgi:UBX domain-containing protein 1